VFLYHVAIIYSDNLEGHTASICRVSELVQVDAEPVQSVIKMVKLSLSCHNAMQMEKR
jgi:hypothetical protein